MIGEPIRADLWFLEQEIKEMRDTTTELHRRYLDVQEKIFQNSTQFKASVHLLIPAVA